MPFLPSYWHRRFEEIRNVHEKHMDILNNPSKDIIAYITLSEFLKKQQKEKEDHNNHNKLPFWKRLFKKRVSKSVNV